MNYFHVLYVINFPSFYSAFSVLYFLLVYIFIIAFSIRFFFSQRRISVRRISVHLVDLVKSFQTSIYYLLVVFTWNHRLRYSRERVSQSLPNISQKLEKS